MVRAARRHGFGAAAVALLVLDVGPTLAGRLGVGYVVDPKCEQDVAGRLGGTPVVENEEVVVLMLDTT